MSKELEKKKKKIQQLVADSLSESKKLTEVRDQEPLPSPTPPPENKPDFTEITDAIGRVGESIKPTDLTPIIKALQALDTSVDVSPVVEAIENIPTQEVDLAPIVDALQDLKESLPKDRTDDLAEKLTEAIKKLPAPTLMAGGGSQVKKIMDVSGTEINPATSDNQTNGNQLTQITGPLSVFGELITVEPTPIVQIANQYQLDPANRSDLETFEATGGSADNSGNLFRCQTGTSAGGYSVIRSKEAVIYRPGEGLEGLITAAFTTGVATSLQFGGLFSLTETIAFGYNGADFSTIYSSKGAAEVQSIQVTGAASSGANCTVTLDGDAVAIALTVSTVQTNAEEIRAGLAGDATVSGKWRVEQVDDMVYAIAKSVGNKTGTMSFAAGTTGATATVTEETTGVAKTDNHTAQASWNVTTSPFTGFDPTNQNVYKVSFGYLGIANINFEIYNPNTGLFVLVHRQQFASNQSTTSLGSPDLKIGWTSASLGSTGTNLIVTGGSAEAAIEGKEIIKNNTFAADNTVASVDTTLTNLVTIKNRIVYGDRFNQGKIFPLDVSVDNDHTKGAVVEIYTNATLGGTTNYQYEDEFNSIALVDKSGTTVTGGNLVDAFTVPKGGDAEVDLKKLSLTLNPEDTITIAARTISGTSTNITGAFVWQEEK